MSQRKSQQRVARAAVLVMVAFAVSRVLGLVRQVVFSHYFGTGPEMDAYVAAQRIPEMLFLVIAGGALGAAFIPTFTARLTEGDARAAWRLASSLINLLLVVLVPLSLLVILIAPWLVQTLVAPALPPPVQVRTVLLMRVMLLSTVIFGVSGIVMGALNAHQHFLLPALAPIFYNIALIAGAVIGGTTAAGMLGPAVAMVVGAVIHLGVQVPGLIRYRARYTPVLGLANADVRTVGRLMAPRVLGVAAVQINMVVTNSLASGLGIGAIAALDYAWRVMLLPQGIFAQAVGTAAFPTFSAQAARGDLSSLRETLAFTLRMMIAVTLPATVGLVMLGQPIIAVIFERGAFDAAATQEVALALAFFSVGLVGHSMIEVLARAFYALHDTWTPALAAAGAVILNLGLGLWLPNLFVHQMGIAAHAGLALANALAALIEMAALLVLMANRLGGLEMARIGGLVARASVAALGMAPVLVGWLRFGPPLTMARAVGGVALGVASFTVLALALRITEFWEAVQMIVGRRSTGRFARSRTQVQGEEGEC
ncbi:MAG: murein biosynthesis integral membrane protein MurJ [Chloroflexi bacterium]|nr:murein biosynthesis integral membrane protein MurJ [Chloroflexota bacterium]